MESLEYIRLIWDYNHWAHHKLRDSLMTISHEDFVQEIDYGLGSLHRHFVHLMWAEGAKLARIQNRNAPDWTIADFPTRESIIENWKYVECDYRNYLTSLDNEELNRKVHKTAGQTDIQPIYEILIHAVNHGTDHRAQMLRMIGDYGGETFPQDMAYYFREKRLKQEI